MLPPGRCSRWDTRVHWGRPGSPGSVVARATALRERSLCPSPGIAAGRPRDPEALLVTSERRTSKCGRLVRVEGRLCLSDGTRFPVPHGQRAPVACVLARLPSWHWYPAVSATVSRVLVPASEVPHSRWPLVLTSLAHSEASAHTGHPEGYSERDSPYCWHLCFFCGDSSIGH